MNIALKTQARDEIKWQITY